MLSAAHEERLYTYRTIHALPHPKLLCYPLICFYRLADVSVMPTHCAEDLHPHPLSTICTTYISMKGLVGQRPGHRG